MNPDTKRLLDHVESLGDNGELDHVIGALACRASNSLFRWSSAPVAAVTQLLEKLPLKSAFCFENLVPSAPGMVLDTTLGFQFFSSMKSSKRGGELVFNDEKATRQTLHAIEKQRFDNELDRLVSRLTDSRFCLYVVKANTGLDNDAVEALEAQLRRHRSGPYVLVAVSEKIEPNALHWQSDTCALAGVPRLAPYAFPKKVDLEGWLSLFDRLSSTPFICLALKAMNEGPFLNWNTALPLNVKDEQLYLQIRELNRFEALRFMLKQLSHVDQDYRRYLGGDILDTLSLDGTPGTIASAASNSLAEDFDNRYWRLMALHANVDLAETEAFNNRGEALYQRFGKSLVRYSRIDGQLKSSRTLLQNYGSICQKVVRVSPMSNASFSTVTMMQNSISDIFATAEGSHSTVLDFVLDKPRKRQFKRLSEQDDTDRAESNWLEPRREQTIRSIEFHVLNDARISWQPSSVVFREAGAWRYASATSDMYHHSRFAGRVGLGEGKLRVPSAYFLPRFGPPGNHYHTLVDKLPTLFGYKLLGLNCPLIAAYQPNETMFQMMDLMGIERTRVLVDMQSDAAAESAIVPTPVRLRPLFVDFCQSLPIKQSPLGSRIYIARGDSSGRGMQNESDVQALLQQYEFDVVRMEEHDFEVQRAICANAEIVVAPHGAGLTNMIFSPSGCRIVELIPERYMVRCFGQLAIECGHSYAVLLGRMNPTRPGDGPVGQTMSWNTDIGALQRLLNDLYNLRADRTHDDIS